MLARTPRSRADPILRLPLKPALCIVTLGIRRCALDISDGSASRKRSSNVCAHRFCRTRDTGLVSLFLLLFLRLLLLLSCYFFVTQVVTLVVLFPYLFHGKL